MIGALSTFFTLTVLTSSPLSGFGWPGMISLAPVPFTGGFIRAFINSVDSGGGAGAASLLAGVAAADLLDCAKAAGASARQQKAADVSARRLIVFLLRGPGPG